LRKLRLFYIHYITGLSDHQVGAPDATSESMVTGWQTSLNKEKYSAVLNSVTLKRNHLLQLFMAGQSTPKKEIAFAGSGTRGQAVAEVKAAAALAGTQTRLSRRCCTSRWKKASSAPRWCSP
jgi:hypothetical protein